MENKFAVKKTIPKYSFLFEKTVTDFTKNNRLFSQNICCAVSGGLDSVVLAHIASKMSKQSFFQNLSFLHINHQTRKETHTEKELVKKLAKSLGAKFISRKISGLKLDDPSFEEKARTARQKIYQSIDATIWCAHHLDDSFEWSLKQQFSSSSYKGFEGIPVKTPIVSRPFLCVTKEQIKKYAKQNHIEWMEDVSNSDDEFERAYIRKHLIPKIKKRYPQYLKHYARRSQAALETLANTYEIAGSKSHHFLLETGSSLNKKALRYAIKKLSNTERGKTELQIQKIDEMVNNGRMGPMSFSGGVEVFNLSHHLILTNKNYIHELKRQKFNLEPQRLYDYQSYQLVFEQLLKTDFIMTCWAAVPIDHEISEYRGGHPLLPLELRRECQIHGLKLISGWKLLRHLRSFPNKKHMIALVGLG